MTNYFNIIGSNKPDAHLEKPEMGDTVEFKAPGEYGGIITMRGEFVDICKNGKIRIDVAGKVYTVAPEDVFVLSKGERP